MNKVTAHLVFAALDIAALAACVYVFTEWRGIDRLISASSDSISVQSHLGFYALMIMVPVTHILALLKWQAPVKKWVSRFLVALFLLLIVGAFNLGSYIEDKLLTAGYHYCAEQSETMTFSEFRTYLKENIQCSE